jgi:hypothetical protein
LRVEQYKELGACYLILTTYYLSLLAYNPYFRAKSTHWHYRK